MKKNSRFCQALFPTALFAVALTVAACSGDDDVTPTPTPHDMTITATQPGSRMGFDSTGAGFWQTGDAIAVFSENGSDKSMSKFTLTDGAETAKATFTGRVEYDRLTLAFYPYNENHKHDGDNYTFCFSDTYTYSSVDQEYSVVKGNSFNMPMVAEFSDDNQTTVAFKHIGSVLAIKIDRMPATEGTLTVTAKEDITGNAALNEDNTLATPTDGGKTVTFNYSGAIAMKSGVFYLPLPAGTYTSGLAVTVAGTGTNGENTSKFYTTSDITIEKGHIKALTVNTNYSKTIDGHDFIDLGLPSGLLWASANIGATTQADAGSYFAWGETATKTNYGGGDYSTDLFSKYTADGAKLGDTDDAATAIWKNAIRMPYDTELAELLNSEYTTVSINSGNTCTITGKNGRSIVLPVGGYMSDATKADPTNGYYWTKTFAGNGNAYCLKISSDAAQKSTLGRVFGCNVRPVAEP